MFLLVAISLVHAWCYRWSLRWIVMWKSLMKISWTATARLQLTTLDLDGMMAWFNIRQMSILLLWKEIQGCQLSIRRMLNLRKGQAFDMAKLPHLRWAVLLPWQRWGCLAPSKAWPFLRLEICLIFDWQPRITFCDLFIEKNSNPMNYFSVWNGEIWSLSLSLWFLDIRSLDNVALIHRMKTLARYPIFLLQLLQTIWPSYLVLWGYKWIGVFLV